METSRCISGTDIPQMTPSADWELNKKMCVFSENLMIGVSDKPPPGVLHVLMRR